MVASIYRYITKEIERARGKTAALVDVYTKRCMTHKKYYNRAMVLIQREEGYDEFIEFVAVIKEAVLVRSQAKYGGNGKGTQVVSDVWHIYKHGFQVRRRYEQFVDKLCDLSSCKYEQVSPKGWFRCIEKIGLRRADDTPWDGCILTDVIRGAASMDDMESVCVIRTTIPTGISLNREDTLIVWGPPQRVPAVCQQQQQWSSRGR